MYKIADLVKQKCSYHRIALTAVYNISYENNVHSRFWVGFVLLDL